MNPNYKEYKFPQIKVHTWTKVFKDRDTITRDAIDLISSILVYDPSRRLQPLDALAHPYFDEVRN